MLSVVRFAKLLGLISGIVLLNVVVLSPGLLGVEIGGENVLETASGVTLLVISLLVVIYGSYSLLFKPTIVRSVQKITTHEDYITALSQYRHVKALKKDILLALDQLSRMEKKKDTMLEVLSQRFEPSELSFTKFKGVTFEVEKLFYRNIRGVLNKLSVFDASGFSHSTNLEGGSPSSTKLLQKKSALYNEYLAYVSGYLGANEEILLKLDQLLLEITLLDSTDYKDVEDMPCMKEIDELIKQTKLYKQ